MFENIECEWPLFFELLLLDALIRGDTAGIKIYRKKLEGVVLRDETEGIVTVPELYLVPEDKVCRQCVWGGGAWVWCVGLGSLPVPRPKHGGSGDHDLQWEIVCDV